MADITLTLDSWSTTSGNNNPDNSDAVGPNTLADNQRVIQAVVRQMAASSTIASAATTDLSTINEAWITVSGTTTITAFGTLTAGMWKWLRFSGALTLTHNATSLILPGAANITTVAGDTALFKSEGSGNWRCHSYLPTSGRSVIKTFLDTEFTIQDDGDTTKQAKFQASGITTATTRTFTLPDVSDTLVTLAATQALTNKTYNGNTFTAGTGVLTIAASKTLTASNTLTLAGTDATVMTFPTTSATIARTDAANTFTGVQTMTSPAITTPAFTGTATGTYTLGGTPTIAAHTLSGTVSGGGNQINNVIIGTSTPLAGSFTTVSGSTSILSSGTGGVGYKAGAGGTVTQASSKTTGVTLSTPTGKIVMNNAALAANTAVGFTWTNTTLVDTDTVAWTMKAGAQTGSAYNIWFDIANGAATVYLKNISAGSLSEAVTINFSVLKGVLA